MTRPANLPDFKQPPINEVVLGIQFAPAPDYKQIDAYEVWQLFKADYPTATEQPPIAPAFETFGRPQNEGPTLQFEQGVMPVRYWFISPTGNELIQFQNDRLLHNWRQIAVNPPDVYPRFETLLRKFDSEIQKVVSHFAARKHTLTINQCEVSYINHILIDGTDLQVDRWLSFLKFPTENPDDCAARFRFTIRSADGKPSGRLTCEVSTGAPEGKRLIILNLTFRGPPRDGGIANALSVLEDGRKEIVTRFAALTTADAHKVWGRIN